MYIVITRQEEEIPFIKISGSIKIAIQAVLAIANQIPSVSSPDLSIKFRS